MFARGKKAAVSATRAGSRSRGLWVEVDPGFYVGNDGRQFLGSVNGNPAGGFSAFSARSEFIGRFSELDDARDAVIATARTTSSAGAPESVPN